MSEQDDTIRVSRSKLLLEWWGSVDVSSESVKEFLEERIDELIAETPQANGACCVCGSERDCCLESKPREQPRRFTLSQTFALHQAASILEGIDNQKADEIRAMLAESEDAK